MFILDAMAFERLAAVFQPFKFERNRNIVKRSITVTIMIWLVTNVLKFTAVILIIKRCGSILTMFMWVLFSLGFVCMVSAYPVITHKLLMQKRKNKIGANLQRQKPFFVEVPIEPNGFNNSRITTRYV